MDVVLTVASRGESKGLVAYPWLNPNFIQRSGGVDHASRLLECCRPTFLQNPGPCAHGVLHLSAASVLVARYFTGPNALVWVFSGLVSEACYTRFGVVVVSIVGRTMVSGFYLL
ncbi:hypothetical protein J1N35_029821 [Gossypium stocksii]|uniref:Uncharacterized protein n=1 Tax=Gossypium stocksii TaxID=47602 RepID=A0A9D3V0R9_9ROSI|nr:hypothetical protein J1N35_029821 [Gossypium stocksii]